MILNLIKGMIKLENKNQEDIIQIRIDISGRTKKMFLAFMDKYNLERYTDTFRLIIKRAYDLDIKKESERIAKRSTERKR